MMKPFRYDTGKTSPLSQAMQALQVCDGVTMSGSTPKRPYRRVRFVQPAGCQEGFTLIETLISIFILSFGLLAAALMMYATATSASLSRSKSSGALAAQNKLEFLADLYRQNQTAADLAEGVHGPELVEVVSPVDGTVLNKYRISWAVARVNDPRPGKVLAAKQAAVKITPIDAAGNINNKIALNKVVSVTGIFSTFSR